MTAIDVPWLSTPRRDNSHGTRSNSSCQPSCTQRIAVPISPDAVKYPLAVFCFAWAVTLGAYLDSQELVIGFAFHGWDGDTSIPSAGTCRIRIRPEQEILPALDEVVADGDKGLRSWVAQGAGSETDIAIQRKEVGDSLHPAVHGDEKLSPEIIITPSGNQGPYHVQGRFDPHIVAPALAHMMLHQFAFAVQGIVRGQSSIASSQVKDLQAISPDGMAQLMRWNRQSAAEEDGACVQDLIQRTCQQQPHAMAVCAWDGSWSYQELDCQASHLASQLCDHGIEPEKFVGLLFEKSKWTTVAILAVLKAGGAFVLLDPTQPAAYLSAICTMTRTALLLCSSHNQRLAAELRQTTIQVPRDPYHGAMPTSDFRRQSSPAVQPHHTLYACFTSGSTGRPKGFIIDHVAFNSGLQTYAHATGLGCDSRVFQFASYSFAPSITDQLASLIVGASICVPAEEELQNDVEGSISQLQATWLKLTPSVARTLDPGRLPCVKTLILVGEEAQVSDVAAWQDHGITVLGLYGQSENAKGTMVSRKSSEDADPGNIGSPFCAVGWVVDPDDYHRLMPIGATGELLLESPCLCRGYIDNEDETKLAFVSKPSWLTQGNRVKLRGQRLELAQVEHHLRSCLSSTHPVLADVVQPANENGRDPMLVAFVPWADSQSAADATDGFFAPPTKDFQTQARAVLGRLRHLLPSFMVPSTLLAVRTIPRTGTGKIHRRRLREAASMLSRKQLMAYISPFIPYRAPETELERKLQRACGRLLNIEADQISMQDNFFDLGGNSLTARQLVAVARAEGLQVSVAQIFQQPTLAGLAQTDRHPVRRAEVPRSSHDPDPFGRVRDDVRREGLPHIARGNIEDALPVLYTQMTTARDHCVDFFPLRVIGNFVWHGLGSSKPSPFYGRCSPDSGAALSSLLSGISETQTFTESSKLHPARRPRSGQGPSAAGSSALVLRLCHAQYDGSCLEHLVRSLMMAYHGRPLVVESDFQAYTRTCLRLRIPEVLDFWRRFLAGSSPTQLASSMTGDREAARKINRSFFRREVNSLAAPAGFTLATVVKAAWSWVLRNETRSEDVVFGQLVSCRGSVPLPHADTIIGPCMNIIPVRVGRDLLGAVQAQHAQTMEFDMIGMDEIVRHCTSWPAGTEPDSIIIHENFHVDWEVHDGGVTIQKIAAVFNQQPSSLTFLITIPTETGLIAVLMAPANMSSTHADRVLDLFCNTLTRLAWSPAAVLRRSE
ncbi:Nonribosomal peptide synthetase 6 [Aspergillus fumigatus]|nr:Nonribosomal peptide synthetase 6 [Aspergillus fumigatus]KAH1406801.1 Nonribosomal peptide synthetase 6 [Aspergillus fumigatus]KAH1462299.1 Nonribosomal peptide synthetase 6 [Aspergillus fumigatus]KAH1516111.1 Nonribosomal peptide synthetase 6 [Aspergillus fumigatus]KAH1529210.1 Nonribosomal peptide synthetase 6 [Aspergillus fumigatus]